MTMGLFCKCKDEWSIIEKLLSIIEWQAEMLKKCRDKSHKVHLAITTIINNSKFIIMSVTLDSSQKVDGVLALIDDTTLQPVPATFSGSTAVSDNAAVCTAAINDDGSGLEVTAVAAGTANVVVTATAAFTNSLGQPASGSVSSTISVTVTAVVVADGVHLEITFGAPQPK